MKIGIGCDHNGIELKESIINYIRNKKIMIEDFGPYDYDALDDYPDYAFAVGEAIRDNKIDLGILICGTGIGMCIAANRMSNVRCARVFDKKEARMARLHNNANVLAFSSKMCFFKAKKIIDIFLETSYSDLERHNTRLKKLEELR